MSPLFPTAQDNVTVSVLIPNYNHAAFLPQRIDSVINQTFDDIEIILMDDCSADDSRSIISDYATRDARIRVVMNDKNSGSTFSQWNKGIALAKGKYVWIAESDDYAEINFLQILVSVLDANPEVGLAYANSLAVDERGNVLNDVKDALNDSVKTSLWNEDFIMNGRIFLKEYMSFVNGIPNASAVLIRKSILNSIGKADDTMRLAGDWVHWNKALYVSDIGYVREPLNYFRTHVNNVRSNTVKNGVFIVEISRVMAMIKLLFPNEPYNYKSIKLFVDYWILSYRDGYVTMEQNLKILKNISGIVDNRSVLAYRVTKFVFKSFLTKVRTMLKAIG
ncbi:MAG TPA: glycosyltransferase [Hymenobacter sp.]|jgi:glycosyltransferase involved in cell wall biosynthesis|uniref:glycosyltransferase n=1 Tax=Hymenobacter sp. TaxID=1898978 RepID=UPI002EDA3B8A